jgi:hypothetical protein
MARLVYFLFCVGLAVAGYLDDRGYGAAIAVGLLYWFTYRFV